MERLTIHSYQIDLNNSEPERNFEKIETFLFRNKGADICIFPEMFPTGYVKDPALVSENMDGFIISNAKQLAFKYNTAIAFSFICEENGVYYNRFVFVAPDNQVFMYDKKHLFSISGENLNYTAGKNNGIFKYKGWRIRPAICYDLRFPVWLRNRNDYDLLLIVANWPSSRRAIWDVLLKARAIENQVFVAASNRIGTDAYNVNHNGGSAIIDPKGEVEAMLPDDKEDVAISSIDKKVLESFRTNFPFYLDADDFTLE